MPDIADKPSNANSASLLVITAICQNLCLPNLKCTA